MLLQEVKGGNTMRFKKIYIEITNMCNLKCSFCIQNQREAKQMSVEEFERIIKQIQPYTKYVYLHVLGEPLSHPMLKELLAICEQYELFVNLTTNGTLLKQKKDTLMEAKALRQINVSLHSFTQHEQIQTDEYLQQVFSTCDALAEQGVYISYRLWNMKQGVLSEDTKQLLTKIKQYYPSFNETKEYKKTSICLNTRRFLHFEEVFQWPSLNVPIVSEKGKCYGMKTMCAILSNGEVVACCLDSKGDTSFGNLLKEDMEQILQRSTQFCDRMRQGILLHPLCQRCGYRTRFDR